MKASRASSDRAPDLPKVPRTETLHLHVETDHCPVVLSRILEIIRTRGALAFTITAQRTDRVQFIAFEMGLLSDKAAGFILHDLRRLHFVRSARFVSRAESTAPVAIPAKL